MIDFKDLTIQDKELVTSFTMKSKRRNCDLSFSNLCSWRFLYQTQLAVIDNFLVFKFWTDQRLAYMLPVGEGDLSTVLRKLREDANQEGHPFCLLGVCSECVAQIEQFMPGEFEFTADRDYADYIYLRTDLIELKGKKFQPKRNHINKFRKEYNSHYEMLTPQHIPACLELEDEWCRANDCNQENGTAYERQALRYALRNFEALGLMGGVLYVEDQIVAFTFGMPINQETFGIHVEKADIRINGAYATINQEFASRIPEQYIYVNREEDLGIEGLRKAKLSYQPVTILEKYMGTLKNANA